MEVGSPQLWMFEGLKDACFIKERTNTFYYYHSCFPMYQKSEIDELFYRLMGFCPKKSGQAYEIISSAALGIIKSQIAEHNKYIKGESGGRPYQLDGLIGGNIMVESKDYTIDDKKVGRSDLQKMQGALTDLKDIKEGIFTSATSYTKDAIKYAEGSESNGLQKPITTVDIRPSTTEDEKDRVKKIVVTMRYSFPDYNRGNFDMIYAAGGREMINDYMINHGLNEFKLNAALLYNSKGDVLISIAELSRNNPPKYNDEDQFVSGEFLIDGAFVKFIDLLVPIKGIKYNDVPITRGSETFTIEEKGNATLLISSAKMGVNKLITDLELKKAIESIMNGASIR